MSKLAVNGGPKAINRHLGKRWPVFGKPEEKMLLEVLHSGRWWRGGGNEKDLKVYQFEDAWAKYHDAKYCVAVTNGTQALECAMKAAGIEPGDEVLVPALTFVASATAIALVNAIPVFVDVDRETFNIDPKAMEAAITPKTTGVVVVHNGGYPADMDAVLRVARKHHLLVIEDSAHAHGSEWKGRRIGALGDFGTFSFQMGKTFTCGEGGAVITNDSQLAEKAFSYHHIGRVPGRPFYEFHRVASNLRMTEFQGAILLAQLKRLDGQTERREKNTAHLAEGMKDIPGVRPIKRDKRVTRWGFYYWNFHYDPAGFDGLTRDAFIKAMAAEGCPMMIGAHGAPIYRNPVFQDKDFLRKGARLTRGRVSYRKTYCPVAEDLFANHACAISHAAFLGPRSDMDLILRAMRKIHKFSAELR